MSMKAELGKLEGGRRNATDGQSPAGLENIRKLRDVKFLESTVELLTKQYQIAKIDEAKDAIVIQLVDKAIPPDHKSKPKRGTIIIFTTLVVALLAVILAFIQESMEKMRLDAGSAGRLKSLRQHLRWR
jgi:uncharacterized protein involved in exopolysaccharide biosynthesis